MLEDLLYLSLESGNTIVSFTPPFAPHEIERYLDTIDFLDLSPSAQEAYNRITRRLNPQALLNLSADNYLFLLNINTTLEGRVRFNSDIPWYQRYTNDQSSHIPALVSIPFRFYFADSAQLHFEPIIAVNQLFYNDGEYFGSNVPLYDIKNADQNMPMRAYVAFGSYFWNFQLGRDRLSFGSGHMANLALSDNPQFYDFARLSFFSDIFKYSVFVSQMPMDIRGIYDTTGINENALVHTTQRYFYMHRFDFLFLKKLSFTITEGVMVGDSALELRYLNPMMVFHSLYSWNNYPQWEGSSDYPDDGTGDMNGSLLSLELNYSIIKSLSVYGQFVMNQFATSYKIDRWGTQPNGLGYLAGARYSGSFNGWGSTFFFEFIYTDPYLYLNPSPFASLINMRYLSGGISSLQYTYLGYPRDTIAITTGARFFNRDKLFLYGEFTWLSQGEHDINWDWENTKEAYYESTPTGTAENNFILSFNVRYLLNSYLTFKCGLSGVYSVNNAHKPGSNIFGGQATASVSFCF